MELNSSTTLEEVLKSLRAFKSEILSLSSFRGCLAWEEEDDDDDD